MLELNVVAKANVLTICATFDVSHFEMSLLNKAALSKVDVNTCTLDVSQSDIVLLNELAFLNV